LKNPLLLGKLVEDVRSLRQTAVVDDDFPEALHSVDSTMAALDRLTDFPSVVCLCGSTRFYGQFQKANFDETMAGRIVLSVGFYPHGGFESRQIHGGDVGVTPGEKVKLDELHKRKIDLCDEVLVLNVGGYIGDSTKSEVLYAKAAGKPVRWLEPDKAWPG
jgi:hypothetical protein